MFITCLKLNLLYRSINPTFTSPTILSAITVLTHACSMYSHKFYVLYKITYFHIGVTFLAITSHHLSIICSSRFIIIIIRFVWSDLNRSHQLSNKRVFSTLYSITQNVEAKYYVKLTWKICFLETKYRFWTTTTIDDDLLWIVILLQFFLLINHICNACAFFTQPYVYPTLRTRCINTAENYCTEVSTTYLSNATHINSAEWK